jgi:hypothetical protein
VRPRHRNIDLENFDYCRKKKREENQHSRVWPRARERKLVIGNLCCSLFLFFFQVLLLLDLIFILDSKFL